MNRTCQKCDKPGAQIPGILYWLCEEHAAAFYKQRRYRANSRAKHPYRNAVKTQNNRARDMGAEGTFTEMEWLDLVARHNERCVRCNHKRTLTIDHIISLSRGGTNYITNIQPLCGPCNYNKKARTKDYRD